ncbi:MAG: AmmeMemoRadiSam system protein B [Nitrospirota bacterium]
MKRAPAVAGQFYYGNASRLRSQVEQYILEGAAKEKAIGIISPHAGLMYSGSVAGAVYSAIRFPRTFILLGPNHTGIGKNASLMSSGEWEIPTGTFPIDEELAESIIRNVPGISEDPQAHLFEHSLEVQLPFIAYFAQDVKIVPLMFMYAPVQECRTIGEGIAAAIKETGADAVIVASSDMSHYVPDSSARKLDNLAIAEVLRLDPEGLYATVTQERISMCGVIPSTIMLFAAKALGAREARLVKYATSGEVSGDYEHVVGYAGVIVS